MRAIRVQEVCVEVHLETSQDFLSEMWILTRKLKALTFKKLKGLTMERAMLGMIRKMMPKLPILIKENVLYRMRQYP